MPAIISLRCAAASVVLVGLGAPRPEPPAQHGEPLLLARAKSLTKTDRGRIVFDSDRTGAPDFVKPDVYVVPSDGTAERQLTFATRPGEFSRMPALSPDGRSIVFQGNREVEGRGLYVMNRSNGNVTRVIAGQAAQPAWSPDGRQIWG